MYTIFFRIDLQITFAEAKLNICLSICLLFQGAHDALLEASCTAQMLPFVIVNVFSSCFALFFSTKILKSHMPLIAP